MVSPKGRAGPCKVAAEWYADGCVVADEAAVVLTRPRNDQSYLMLVGGGQFWMAISFLGSILMPSWLMILLLG